jgi:hypothetical protein
MVDKALISSPLNSAGFDRLNGDDADRFAPIEQGYAQKRMKPLLAGFTKIAIARVMLWFQDGDDLALFDGQAGQALADIHGHLADGSA